MRLSIPLMRRVRAHEWGTCYVGGLADGCAGEGAVGLVVDLVGVEIAGSFAGNFGGDARDGL